jgi:Tat protein translocase TatB subunit
LVLLIGETIGWQELIFIGILALVFLGPRKLPTIARTIGKYMAEFRKAANEFKSTWESEVSSISTEFKEELKDADNDMRMLGYLENPKPVENSIGRNPNAAEENGNSTGDPTGNFTNGEQLELPMVRQVEPPQIDRAEETVVPLETVEAARETKKDWL